MLARLHFVVRLPAGARLPAVDAAGLEAELVEATRSWDEDLADALRSELGEEEAARLLRTWGRGVPRGLQGGLRRAGRGRRPAPRSSAPRRGRGGDARHEPLRAGRRGPSQRRFKLYRARAALAHRRPAVPGQPGRRGRRRAPVRARTAPTAPAHGSTTSACATTGGASTPSASRELFSEAFEAAWSRRAESDGFDRSCCSPAELAPGRGAPRLRQVPAAGRDDLQPGVHRARRCCCNVDARPAARRGCSRRASTPTARSRRRRRGGATDALLEEIRAALDAVASLDEDRILRAFLTLDPGDAAHQLLPARRRRRPQAVPVVQARPAGGARPAAAPADVRDLRVLPAGRGRAPALRPGRPRRPALVATGARTSAPRSSAWSRRRRSRTP